MDTSQTRQCIVGKVQCKEVGEAEMAFLSLVRDLPSEPNQETVSDKFLKPKTKQITTTAKTKRK